MARKEQTINNLSGLVNMATVSSLMKDSEVELGINIKSGKVGAIKKTNGYEKIGTTVSSSGEPQAGHGFYEEDGTRHNLAVYNSSLLENVSGTWTSRYSSLTANTAGEFETFLSYAYYTNGVDQPISSSDATTWSTTKNVTNMPKGKHIKKANNLLYVSKGSRVYFCAEPTYDNVEWGRETGSDLSQTASSAAVTSSSAKFVDRGVNPADSLEITSGSNIGTYAILSVDSNTQVTLTETLSNTATNSSYEAGSKYFDVRDGIGAEITGLEENNNRLIIFKEGSMFRWDESVLTTISSTLGASASRSIKTIDRFTFFLNRKGVFMYDGRYPVLISKKIEKIIQNMDTDNYINAWAMSDDQYYYLWVGDIAETTETPAISDAMIVFDRYQKTWRIEDNITAKLGWSYIDAKQDLYMADTLNVYKYGEVNHKNTKPIYLNLESKKYTQGTKYTFKLYSKVWVSTARKSSSRLSYRVGTEKGETAWVVLGDIKDNISVFNIPAVKGLWIQFKIHEDSTDEGIELEGLSIEFSYDKRI